jgi:hypothetical protein
VQRTYSLSETCSIYEPCTARELYQKDDPKTRRGPEEFHPIDSKGFMICGFCNRPYREPMKKCPECGKYFQGPKPYRPKNFELECEACE